MHQAPTEVFICAILSCSCFKDAFGQELKVFRRLYLPADFALHGLA